MNYKKSRALKVTSWRCKYVSNDICACYIWSGWKKINFKSKKEAWSLKVSSLRCKKCWLVDFIFNVTQQSFSYAMMVSGCDGGIWCHFKVMPPCSFMSQTHWHHMLTPMRPFLALLPYAEQQAKEHLVPMLNFQAGVRTHNSRPESRRFTNKLYRPIERKQIHAYMLHMGGGLTHYLKVEILVDSIS